MPHRVQAARQCVCEPLRPQTKPVEQTSELSSSLRAVVECLELPRRRAPPPRHVPLDLAAIFSYVRTANTNSSSVITRESCLLPPPGA
ncbi:unnamed protein product [Arctogadus glacialis]